MILYGAPVREKIKIELEAKIKKLGRKPALAIVQIGEREDSNIYIKNKIEFGRDIGVSVLLEKFSHFAKATRDKKDLEEKVIQKIEELNENEKIDGIIVQLPLPEGLDQRRILNQIDKKKDTDGLKEVGENKKEKVLITPATAKAVMKILDFYKIAIKNKRACVLGQSILAGKPIADELEFGGAKVERCDINTKNIPEIAKQCDILVSAVGRASLVTKDFVNKNQAVVDVGINRINGKLVGDILFEEVKPLVFAITPVPGGVGPVTVACLFENLIDLCYHNS